MKSKEPNQQRICDTKLQTFQKRKKKLFNGSNKQKMKKMKTQFVTEDYGVGMMQEIIITKIYIESTKINANHTAEIT